MIVLVCGGRAFDNVKLVFDTLDTVHAQYHISTLIHGGATGADDIANEWAKQAGVDRIVFPANWKGRGRSAGPHRNQAMLNLCHPELVVAFPGGNGTADMVRRARSIGVEVLEVKP